MAELAGSSRGVAGESAAAVALACIMLVNGQTFNTPETAAVNAAGNHHLHQQCIAREMHVFGD